MPIPNQLILTDAGTTAVNGTYTKGADMDGSAAWYKEDYRIRKLSAFGNAAWVVQEIVGGEGSAYPYMQVAGPPFMWPPAGTVPDSPVGLTLQVNGSTEPPPVIAAGGGSDPITERNNKYATATETGAKRFRRLLALGYV